MRVCNATRFVIKSPTLYVDDCPLYHAKLVRNFIACWGFIFLVVVVFILSKVGRLVDGTFRVANHSCREDEKVLKKWRPEIDEILTFHVLL